ncbi:MAG: EAL domain-containing protein [Candidatus Caldatribacteriaceae bacterium]
MPQYDSIALGSFSALCYALWLGISLFANPKGKEKYTSHTIYAACVFLGIWLLGVALTRVADSYEEAIFWQRVSVLGWAPIFGALLCWALSLHGSRFLRGWWSYLLVYLPAFLSLVAFSLSRFLAENTQRFAKTATGWAVPPKADFWNLFSRLYCGGFMVLSIALLLAWVRKPEEGAQRKHNTWIVYSLLGASCVSLLFDWIPLSQFPPGPVSWSPTTALFLTAVVPVFSRNRWKYPGMLHKDALQEVTRGEVLSEADKMLLYSFLAVMHMLGGLLYPVTLHLVLRQPLRARTLLWGVLFFALGASIYYLRTLKILEKRRDFLLGLLLSLSAFLIFLHFFTLGIKSALCYLPLACFVLPTVLLGNFWAFGASSMTVAAIQVWLWLKIPGEILGDSEMMSDRLLATLALVAFTSLTLYIRNAYFRRIEEHQEQLVLQKTIVDLSTKLVRTRAPSFTESLKKMLRELGERCKVDYAYFFASSRVEIPMYNAYWSRKRETSRDSLQSCTIENLSWFQGRVAKGDFLFVTDVNALPPEDNEIQGFLKGIGVRSAALIPVKGDKKLLGLLVLGTENKKRWQDHHRGFLKVLANVLADVLERVGYESKIQHMAFYDSLTGLPNRQLFVEHLRKEMQLAKRLKRLLAVAFLDLDSFKTINDVEGHTVGDEVLREIAQRIVRCVRGHDVVARFGGDEFLLLFGNLSSVEEVPPIIERVLHTIREPLRMGIQELSVTASCGIAIYPRDGENPEELVQAADLAMYVSKTMKGNRYSFYFPTLREDARQKRALISGLYRALEQGELVLYYQPQVHARTGNILGLEALLRWRHPDLGLLLPDVFMPLAEQTELIVLIGEFVLRAACKQVAIWRRIGIVPPRMAVNLSSVQLRDPYLVDKVKKALEEAALEANMLELEVTENTVLHDPERTIELLKKLKQLGVRIALDDFGASYSSLFRLEMLPIDRIKIDQRFFQETSGGYQDRAVVESIFDLVKSTNISVIAEGVENDRQINFVVEKGCQEVQGYYYYRPMPPEEVEALLLEKGRKGSPTNPLGNV